MNAVINDPINEGKLEWTGVETLPSLAYNPEVASVGANCQEDVGVVCDLHYRLDWDYLLEAKTSCSDLSTGDIDPCFATFACICDNGYFRVASNMPDHVGTYLGSSNSQTFARYKEALKDDQIPEDKSDDDKVTADDEESDDLDDDTWVIFVIVIGAIVTLVGIGAVSYFYIKRHREN